MNISEYRKKLNESLQGAGKEVDEGSKEILNLAGDKKKISSLITVLNDVNRSSEEKSKALNALNAM